MGMHDEERGTELETALDGVTKATGFIVGTAIGLVGVLVGWLLARGGRDSD
jgi:hypothetical protein